MTRIIRDFDNGLKIQLRVIYALLLREIITRYGRRNIGFLWLFFEPLLFVLGISTLWYFVKNHIHTEIPVMAFAITGYSSVLLWRNTALRCVTAIESNINLLYHQPVRVEDVFMARCILEIIGATFSFIILLGGLIFLEKISWPHDLLQVILGWILLSAFAVSLGFLFGAAAEKFEIIGRIIGIFTFLSFPLSGALFMVDWLPEQLQKFVLWLPMVHGTEMVRHGVFGNVVKTYENPAYMLVCTLIIMFIGMAWVRVISQKVVPQ